jgi:hypothetical protein
MAENDKSNAKCKSTQFFRRYHMSTQGNKIILVSCLILLILLAAGSLQAGAVTGHALLPDGLVMEETFTPGRGRSVGRVQRVQGEAVIMHAGILKGYLAERGMRLYKGDTIMTLENSKIRFRLNDRSILSLSSETRLTLNKSVYDKKKKQRSSFLGMAFGKARFFVVKLLDYKRSEFKVKTPTAVCGVRGSDFILEASASETIATALPDTGTELELWGLAHLGEKPVIVRDGHTSKVSRGQRPTTPVKLSLDEIERKKQLLFDVDPEEGDTWDKEDDLMGKAGDDTGVDAVAELGGVELDLEGPDIPRRAPLISRGGPEKPLPVPDPPKIKEAILEENLIVELPGFPPDPDDILP